MKKYYRTALGIFLTENNDIFKWVETLTSDGIDHYTFKGDEETIEELIQAGDLVKVVSDSEEVLIEVIEKDGVLYLSDGVTRLDSVNVTELWVHVGIVVYCVATKPATADHLVLTREFADK